ncbi:MAG: cytochrome-c peroxidase [Phycisphaerae bacterium]
MSGPRHRLRRAWAGASAALAGAACAAGQPSIASEFSEVEHTRLVQHSPLPDPPADPTNRHADDGGAARLGQFLFFDPRFSSDGRVSCATCHMPEKSFADGKPLGEGVSRGTRNTPALWNVAYNRWFQWDGKNDTLWAQALGPLERLHEIGGTRTGIARAIHDDAELRRAYERVFGRLPDLGDEARFPRAACPRPEQPTHPHAAAWARMSIEDRDAVNRVFANAGKALAAYQRKLLSRGAAFDRFVEGLRENDDRKLGALAPAARRGARLFVGRAQCRVCHLGPNFTSGEFHDTGVPPRNGGPPTDAGRFAGVELLARDPFNAAGDYSDERDGAIADKVRRVSRHPQAWGQFKVPSLRNVAKTAPYMHQGQFATLREVVRFYSTREGAVFGGHHPQETILQPLNLTDAEIDDLVAFLESLTDEAIDEWLKKAPRSPQ